MAVPTFSPIPSDLAALRSDPSARQAYLESLRTDGRDLIAWWVARMVATTNPAQEKLTLLLHGHFPTAISKVRYARFMYGQNQLFRTQGSGNFTQLTQSVATDPAMLIWLDAASDKAVDPNENFARELMERFTMGIGTYTEADVRAAAYCFTGWRLSLRTGAFTISPLDHIERPPDLPRTRRDQLGEPGHRDRDDDIRFGPLRAGGAVEPPRLPGLHHRGGGRRPRPGLRGRP